MNVFSPRLQSCARRFALLLLSAGFLHATTYYVDDTGGSDGNAGTSTGSAWKTLTKANNTVSAGDTVNVRAGTYSGQKIQPSNSGSSGSPILYQAYNGETVTILGTNSSEQVVNIGSKSYVIVKGFTLSGSASLDTYTQTQVSLANSSYCELRDCTIKNLRDVVDDYLDSGRSAKPTGLDIGGSDHAIVDGNWIEAWFIGMVIGNNAHHNQITNNTVISCVQKELNCRGNTASGFFASTLIEGNLIGGDVVADGIQFDDDAAGNATSLRNQGYVIRNNRFFNNAENAIDLKSTSRIVIEGNIITTSIGDNSGGRIMHNGSETGIKSDGEDFDRIASGAIGRGSNRNSTHIIIRNNVLYDNSGGIDGFDTWRIYNNTFVSNNRDYTGPDSTWTATTGVPAFCAYSSQTEDNPGYVFLNNISMNHNHFELHSKVEDAYNVIDHNLYYTTSGSPTFAITDDGKEWNHLDSVGFTDWKSAQAASSGNIGKDVHSLIDDPDFVDVPAHPVWDSSDPYDFPYDFSLASTSPCIDAGAFLTTTSSSGSGTSVSVDDARYFFDGYDIVDGDLIMIDGGTPVEITAVDYDNNILTIASSRSWSSGDSVSLAYSGSAPDIGAIEYTATASPPAAPTNVTATAISDTQITVTWTDNSSNEDNFKVQRKTGGGSWSGVKATAANITTWTNNSLTPGTTYSFRMRAESSVGNSAWSAETSATTTGGSSTTITRQVSSSANDDETGGNLNSPDLELGNLYTGIRFTNVTVPQGATIVSAKVTFRAESGVQSTASVVIYADDVNDAANFSSGAQPDARTTTTASVTWNNITAIDNVDTPDIAAVVQEVVDRGGWSSGNAMVILFEDNGGRADAAAYDEDPAKAPVLEITYQ